MIQKSEPALDMLKEVPDHQRREILAGMRWTLWLSILCAPLGYLTTVLLARVGPQTIGTYGLLSLYISLTSVFLFFGGNGVAIKFLPELEPGKRASFLASYFFVIIAATLPYQIAASLWPKGLKYVLGSEVSESFGVLLIWLAPVYILFSLVLAALKGLLEIKWAQIYNRVITLGSFGIYGVLFFFARPFLAAQYGAIIWWVYFGLTLFVMLLAMRRLLSSLGEKLFSRSSLRFSLPRGFWRYTLGLQSNSILDFLNNRVDYIFILNVAGLAVFGRYVALLTLVSVIPIFATFVLDSLLPSLTNTLASKDYRAARQLTETYLRFILPCGMLAATFATLFARFVFSILGSKYANLAGLGLVAFPVAAVQVLNWFAGTMLTAIGEPHRATAGKATRCIVFCIAFWPLWHRYNLLGAVLAWGIGETVDQIVLLIMLLRKTPFRFSWIPTYGAFLASVCLSAAAAVSLGGSRPLASAGIWIGLIAFFFLVARYSLREIRELAHLVLPSFVSAAIFSPTPGSSEL